MTHVENKLVKERFEEILRILEDNVNKTEMEWLQLCRIAADKNDPPQSSKEEIIKIEIVKNEDDINAQPIFINLENNPIDVKKQFGNFDEEFDSD